MERFLNKVAVVTGAGSGIGAAIVEELLQYDLIVVGLDINFKNLQEISKKISNSNYQGKFHGKKCDVTNKTDIENVFQQIDQEIGTIGILVNSAGILIRTTLLDAEDEDIEKTFSVNVKGLLLCAKEVMKLMIKNNVEGHIININSINGHHIRKRASGLSSTMIYAASKHGVTVLSEGLRQEIRLRKLNIKCTSISPGNVKTPLTENGPEMSVGHLETLYPENVASACLAALNTPSHVLISELTITGIHQEI